ncbi:hypothetical protein ACFFHH_13115 [Cytobacillus solani]|nr:hypothetical protein [Cytobacillus solani]
MKKKLFYIAIALGILLSSTAFTSGASAACGSHVGNHKICGP